MSTALERVIAEQQAEIDRLRARLESHLKHSQQHHESLNEIFVRAASVAEWGGLADCWQKDKEPEWKRFLTARLALRTALREHGFCLGCHSMTCECDDD